MGYDIYLLKCRDSITGIFMPELQKGIFIPTNEGKTIYLFLTEDCGFSDDYINEKVKTVLINGGPVDDIYSSTIGEGGVCALSGAMPGIVGAMMRMGSPYAAMRESITVKPDKSIKPGKEIIFEIKLFNIILSDMGLRFFKTGILIERKRIVDLLTKNREEIYSDCGKIFINGSFIEKRKLIQYKGESIGGLVFFRIEIENENKS